jgi:succinate dehydrogenase hydrophobic anchor subunit
MSFARFRSVRARTESRTATVVASVSASSSTLHQLSQLQQRVHDYIYFTTLRFNLDGLALSI